MDLNDLKKLCVEARSASAVLANLSTGNKNVMLKCVANALRKSQKEILKQNAVDVAAAKANGMAPGFVDRLTLTEKRIDDMATGNDELIKLPDPVNIVLDNYTNYCGLNIKKITVPFGVIGVIYEARPNVTAEVIGLCIKSGNSVVLRGSKDAINSNKAIVDAVKEALKQQGFESGCVQLIEDAGRESANMLMRANGLIDVLIPRGSANLIKSVVENSTVPIIETGAGICHIYVDKSADLKKAEDILFNAKTQRPSVCNAAETLLVDEKIAKVFLPESLKRLTDYGVEIRGCDKTVKIFKQAKKATEQDYHTEYNDLILSVKVIGGLNEAVTHINGHSTKHSDAIIAEDNEVQEEFSRRIDSACVYINASTRFTDGFEFGLGAEVGISTQKLHARGPMGLRELTSYKYIITGNGQTRK